MTTVAHPLREHLAHGSTAFVLFIALASLFFLAIGTHPLAMLSEIARSAWGSGSLISAAGKMLRCWALPKVGRMPTHSE